MIKKVESLDSYYQLIKDTKTRCGSTTTNCMLMPAKIERFIELNRFYYIEVDSGIFFLSDEENFYQGYYYLQPDGKFSVEPLDKPILVRNLYTKQRKNAKLSALEPMLEKAGFELVDTLGQIQGDPDVVLSKISVPVRSAKRLLNKGGFSLVPVSAELIPEMRKMQFEIAEIPYYQVSYCTDEELLEEAREGHLVCIVDKDGAICGVRHFFPEGKSIYGWFAVKEEYKRLYGMALVFSEYMMNHAIEHDYKLSGWIMETNQASIQYHTKLEYLWTGRYMDEWLLPGKKNCGLEC